MFLSFISFVLFFSLFQSFSTFALPIRKNDFERQSLVQRSLETSSFARLIETNTNAKRLIVNEFNKSLFKRSLIHSDYKPTIPKNPPKSTTDPHSGSLPNPNCPGCSRRRRSLIETFKKGYFWVTKRSIEFVQKIKRNFNELKFVTSIQKRKGSGCKTSPTPVGCPQQHDPNCPGCRRRRRSLASLRNINF